jgi:hypothetical protein
MDTFSTDNFTMQTGVNSQVVKGVQRVVPLKIPVPHLSRKQETVKEIIEALQRILVKIK